jgi:hypothetical protein
MALTESEREAIRLRFHELPETEQNYTKGDLNAAIDACENRYETDKSTWASDMETAAPGEFDAAEKRRIAACFFEHKFKKDFN